MISLTFVGMIFSVKSMVVWEKRSEEKLSKEEIICGLSLFSTFFLGIRNFISCFCFCGTGCEDKQRSEILMFYVFINDN